MTVIAEPVAEHCQRGGARVASGLDLNGNGTLEPDEVAATSYACKAATGAAASSMSARLLSITPQAAGANSALGATKIAAGVDANHDGVFDANEVISIEFECNTAPGDADSTGSISLVSVVSEPAGARCQSGGNRLTSEIDRDRNAKLDPEEVASTRYICNGSSGSSGASALVSLLPESSGGNCRTGGSRIASGPDLSGNGRVNADELASTV